MTICDKAWHSLRGSAVATVILKCSFCGKVYARCEACDHGVGNAKASMRAHVLVHRIRGR